MAYKDPNDPRAREANRANSARSRAKQTPEEKEAARLYRKAWQEKNRDKRRQWSSTYYHKHKDQIKKRAAERPCAAGKPDNHICKTCGVSKPFDLNFFAERLCNKFKLNYTCKECTNKQSLVRITQYKYGLSHEEALARRTQPCEICGMKAARMNIDHCHATGKVRGVLCTPCNQGLGAFKDAPDWLRAAADYVERYRGR